jgi:hypothetical protein
MTPRTEVVPPDIEDRSALADYLRDVLGDIDPPTIAGSSISRTHLERLLAQDYQRFPRESLLPLARALNLAGVGLTEDHVLQLLAFCGDPRPLSKPERRKLWRSPRTPGTISLQAILPPSPEEEGRLEDFSRSLEELQDRVAEIALASPERESDLRALVAEVRSAGESLPRARIILPSEDDLSVRLILATSLMQLEEYHSDEALYLTLAGVSVGTAGGVLLRLMDLATGPTGAWWALLSTTILVAIAFFVLFDRTRRRVGRLRDRMLRGRDVELVTDGDHRGWQHEESVSNSDDQDPIRPQ